MLLAKRKSFRRHHKYAQAFFEGVWIGMHALAESFTVNRYKAPEDIRETPEFHMAKMPANICAGATYTLVAIRGGPAVWRFAEGILAAKGVADLEATILMLFPALAQRQAELQNAQKMLAQLSSKVMEYQRDLIQINTRIQSLMSKPYFNGEEVRLLQLSYDKIYKLMLETSKSADKFEEAIPVLKKLSEK